MVFDMIGAISGASTSQAKLTISGYTGDERSLTNAGPEELYLFNEADANYWAFTSSDSDIIFSGRTYQAVLIKRGSIKLDANSLKTQVELETAIDNSFVVNFRNGPIERLVQLTIYRRHNYSPTDFVTYWNGFVRAVKFSPKRAGVIVGLRTASLGRLGLMLKYQRTCGLALYSTRCGISKANASFFVAGNVLTVDGATITATEFGTEADGFFFGGSFRTNDFSMNQKIVFHEGTTIRVSRAVSSLEVGDAFTARAGCDWSRATCRNKFANELNYGGFPYLPDKNPFSGDAIL